MKPLLLAFLISLLSILSAKAQNDISAVIIYTFKFAHNDDTASIVVTEEYETLVKKNEVSYFKTKDLGFDIRNKEILVGGDAFKSRTLKIKQIRQYQNLSDRFTLNAQLCSSEGVFLVKDKMIPIAWKMLNRSKKIKNIECFAAQAEYRGRVWTAWYAPSIPVSSGPWLLYGLPGMILQAEDLKKCVSFECVGIVVPAPDDSKIEIPTVPDKKRAENPITTAKYTEILEKTLRNEEKMSIIKDANGGITFSPASVNKIEVYAFEEKFEIKRTQQKLSDIPKK